MKLDWIPDTDGWLASGVYYTAHLRLLSPPKQGIEPTWHVAIEDPLGRIIRSTGMATADRTVAEAWAVDQFHELELWHQDARAIVRAQAVLRRCADTLPSDEPVVIRQWLERLEAWVLAPSRDLDEVHYSLEQADAIVLYWHSQEGRSVAPTLYGEAVIAEERDAVVARFTPGYLPRHRPMLIHHSGATLRCHSTFVDFLDAEAWIAELLNQLAIPHLIPKRALDPVMYSLAICQALVDQEADPVAYGDVLQIKEAIGEYLS